MEQIIRYCNYDASTFKVIGFYSNKIHKADVPEPNVVITLENIESYNQNQHTHVDVADGGFIGFKTVEVVLSYDEALAQAIMFRQKAYNNESDPLHMEWQYDQTAVAEQTWRDKVAEIKLRYPLPAV